MDKSAYKQNKKLCLLMIFLLLLISVMFIPNKSEADEYEVSSGYLRKETIYKVVADSKTPANAQYDGVAWRTLSGEYVRYTGQSWWKHGPSAGMNYNITYYFKSDGPTPTYSKDLTHMIYTSSYDENDDAESSLVHDSIKKMYSKYDWSNGKQTQTIYRTAYCLNIDRKMPSGSGYITKASYSATSDVSTAILQYTTLTEEQQKKIGLILSSGFATIGDKETTMDGTQAQRLIDFRKATGISDITQNQLNGATQYAIWNVLSDEYHSSGNSTIDAAIEYLVNLEDYPKVSINGEDTATFTETNTYRIYGPYTASYTGVVKNSIINLQASSDNVKILTSKDSIQELSTLDIEKDKEFYVKVYYDQDYDNQTLQLVTAKISYYQDSYSLDSNGGKTISNKTGHDIYVHKGPGETDGYWIYSSKDSEPIWCKPGYSFGSTTKIWSKGQSATETNKQDVIVVTEHGEGEDITTLYVKWIPTDGTLNFYKVDENGKNLVGAQFELKPNIELTQIQINEILKNSKNVKNMKWDTDKKVFTFENTADDASITTEGPNGNTVIATQIPDLPKGTYTLRETKAAEGYKKEEKSITLTVVNGTCGIKLGSLIISTQGIGYTNTKIALDLGLEKWVSKVESAVENTTEQNNQEENTENKTYKDRNTYDNEVEKRVGDIYVKEGDIVTYTIRIFNHGNVDATATKIVDNIPAGLEFVADNETNKKYGWAMGEDGKIYTTYLSTQSLIEKHHDAAGTAHNGLNYNNDGSKNEAKSCQSCKYADVQIAFKVKNLEGIKRIINTAEIIEYVSEYDADYITKNETTNDLWEGYKAVDIDSTPENHPEHDFEKAEEERANQENTQTPDESNTEGNETQTPGEDNKEETAAGKTTRPEYTTPSQTVSKEEGPYYREDDEDIAVIVPANFDLALEKWVSKVIRKDGTIGQEIETKYEDRNTQDNNVENREGDIKVRTGDTVVYTIRIYNQGNIDGYAEKILDSNPDGLEFIEDNEINQKYGWTKAEDGKIYTTFLSKENGEKLKEELAAQENKTEETTQTESQDTQVTENSETKQETTADTEIKDSNEQASEISTEQTMTEEKAFYEMYKEGTKIEKHEEWTQHIGKNFENGEYKPGSCENCDYKEIQIAFKVGKTVKENKESITRIINLAEIVEDKTEVPEKNVVDGEEKEVIHEDIPDIDSTPNNYVGEFEEGRTREDDEDIAVIVPEVFDLALQKWITNYEITVNGETKTVETTQNYDSTIEEKTGSKLVKIDLDAKKLSSTSIKVKYGIRVANEGNIPGYVKELKDYIPAGTEFYVEDNLDESGNAYWALDGKQIVTSTAYENQMNTLMQPGDSQIFYVTLRWVNSQENMGLKNNIVEISKDYNEWDVPDIDSDPGNVEDRLETKNWEDDEDEVPFLLTVKTGEWIIYFGVTFTVLLIALGVTLIIKKRAAQRI